ncbi:hypothetical protein IE53DRAFT_413370 [Violaceomyces palustris]|uniref:Uncharacterized protein n=1 Tax=Violaceomyces palustris TaxID=1673888 RepID=A0ACD0NMD8_9BASI|nr:hypothetical protein IE53DRAFT_413370 [Violaceomyces palustris]
MKTSAGLIRLIFLLTLISLIHTSPIPENGERVGRSKRRSKRSDRDGETHRSSSKVSSRSGHPDASNWDSSDRLVKRNEAAVLGRQVEKAVEEGGSNIGKKLFFFATSLLSGYFLLNLFKDIRHHHQTLSRQHQDAGKAAAGGTASSPPANPSDLSMTANSDVAVPPNPSKGLTKRQLDQPSSIEKRGVAYKFGSTIAWGTITAITVWVVFRALNNIFSNHRKEPPPSQAAQAQPPPAAASAPAQAQVQSQPQLGAQIQGQGGAS